MARNDRPTDQATDAARSAASSVASGFTTAVRAVLRAIMAVPMIVGRLGVVAGRAGVHLGTFLTSFSNLLSTSSTKARDAMEKAKALEVPELAFDLPRVTTKATLRRERNRRFGLIALVTGLLAGIGAGITVVTRRKRQEQELADEALWNVATDGTSSSDQDDVIDVTAAER